MERTFLVPLIPAEGVLFPTASAVLTLSEWERPSLAPPDALVGVVPRRAMEMEEILFGTLARITERDPERRTIVLVGEYRFQVRRLLHSHPDPIAEVVPLPHPEGALSQTELQERVQALRRAVREHTHLIAQEEGAQARSPERLELGGLDPARLAYQIAAAIPLPLSVQLELLQADRLDRLLSRLTEAIRDRSERIRATPRCAGAPSRS
ncbi:MAG: hypothetical protein KatS3mg115_1345 [Candidatus Poribacteria bacterium]|nr:MAG: hypothetical protein KatS3mg115_1345 [Candidatus Poribacteria bacterium]